MTHLYRIVEQGPRAPETAIVLLLMGEPEEGLRDICFMDEDIFSSLSKTLQHKGCEPGRGGRECTFTVTMTRTTSRQHAS